MPPCKKTKVPQNFDFLSFLFIVSRNHDLFYCIPDFVFHSCNLVACSLVIWIFAEWVFKHLTFTHFSHVVDFKHESHVFLFSCVKRNFTQIPFHIGHIMSHVYLGSHAILGKMNNHGFSHVTHNQGKMFFFKETLAMKMASRRHFNDNEWMNKKWDHRNILHKLHFYCTLYVSSDQYKSTEANL